MKLAFNQIELHPRCQARAELTSDAVRDYAEAYSARTPLPPLEVFDVDGVYYLVDGFHRMRAALAAGVEFLSVTVVGKGTLDDASWYATGVNKLHGVRRSDEDKRKAVRIALEGIGAEMSNRAIAEHVGVSDKFVSKVRADWEAEQVRPTAPESGVEPVKRRGKDGKFYTVGPRQVRPTAPEQPPQPRRREVVPPVAAPTSEPANVAEAPLPFETPEAPSTAQPMPAYGATLTGLAARLRAVRLAARREIPEELNGVRQRVETSVRAAEVALEQAAPVVCETCGGEGCVACGQQGWTSRMVAAR